jgi:hypothetical protein
MLPAGAGPVGCNAGFGHPAPPVYQTHGLGATRAPLSLF